MGAAKVCEIESGAAKVTVAHVTSGESGETEIGPGERRAAQIETRHIFAIRYALRQPPRQKIGYNPLVAISTLHCFFSRSVTDKRHCLL